LEPFVEVPTGSWRLKRGRACERTGERQSGTCDWWLDLGAAKEG
jgi:hypothetical protein